MQPRTRDLMILVLFLLAAGPAAAGEPARLLVFSKTAGFRHGSIPAGVAAVQEMGAREGFAVEATEDAAAFTGANLARFASVVFLNTTGDVLDDAQQEAFEAYVRGGGGYVGVHAAADTEYDWPWYGELVGAYFKRHPQIQEAEILVADRCHPATASLPERWRRTDEWYDYRASPRGNVHVLAALDETSYQGASMGYDHPISWCHDVGAGRAFYTGLGHTIECYTEPAYLEHLRGGILWAARLVEADAGATIASYYEKVVLDDDVTDPMELAVTSDGRVLLAERGGAIKLWRPGAARSVTAGTLQVTTLLEDGLLGITLDPAFDHNGWLYVYYAPAGERPENVLSRLTLVGDRIDPDSEVRLLTVGTQREECCHSGGSLAFDGDGNLYLSTGDNTSPFASDGYSPIDERPGRSPFDAQKSSASTHDLRGKVLRIHPRADDGGGYDIPAGNLFSPDGRDGRPEIYVMGCRNPFRIGIDRQRGWLYWGDVGPDAAIPNPTRGPAGHDELNRATRAGNFGWPYFVGDNKAYADFDFATGESGAFYDPERPRNDSPANRGNRILPPAQPALVWYPYGPSPEFPVMAAGGRCAMGGPVYHFDPGALSRSKLPRYLDDAVFFYEWARDRVFELRLDDEGALLALNPFLQGMSLKRPMDMEIGADGHLYVIEWGSDFGGGNDDAQLVRIDYHPRGERPPVATATATATSGAVPLVVGLDASASAAGDADGGAITFEWDTDGDLEPDATAPVVEATYATPGSHVATLTVTDSRGLSSHWQVSLVAGNTQPTLAFDWPPDGGIADFGEKVEVRLTARDAEDGGLPAEAVRIEPLLLHDTHEHVLPAVAVTGGAVTLPERGAHAPEDDLRFALAAEVSDAGGQGARALTARASVRLQPRRKQAERCNDRSAVRLIASEDPTGGGRVAHFTQDGAWIAFEPISFAGLEGLSLRVASDAGGGALELRLDAPDGELLYTVSIEPRGLLALGAGAHPVELEMFENSGGAGLVWSIMGGGQARRTVPADMLRHGGTATEQPAKGAFNIGLALEGAQPGLHADYYELRSPAKLPDFRKLSPYAEGVVQDLALPSTNGEVFGSGRTDQVGVVFTGWLVVPAAGYYSFALSSDDGSRLTLDGDVIIDNDGLHAMVEKSIGREWQDVTATFAAPAGTHTLYLVYRTPDGDPAATVLVNWIDFRGLGVAAH